MTETIAENPIRRDADSIREKFHSLLVKANKERPKARDVDEMSKLLTEHKDLRLWSAVIGMGALAESQVLDTITNGRGQGMRECWKGRLESLRTDLGYSESPPLEKLLIQQVTLCWLNLNLMEYRHTNIMKQSISIAAAAYWDKRLTMAQQRFTRACESLARVRRLSRRMPIQVNIATQGGQQINVAGEGKI